jgi:hypothetical protein
MADLQHVFCPSASGAQKLKAVLSESAKRRIARRGMKE